MSEPVLRPIRAADDAAIAAVIRDVMTEHGCSGPGFAIHDAEVAAMSRHYAGRDAQYWVVELDGAVVGGAGFARLAGSEPAAATCELRKMYFRPVVRGRGLGARLLATLLDEMRGAGFRHCYLETTTQMVKAQDLYRRFGFVERCGSQGATGHFGCDRFFVRDLDDRDRRDADATGSSRPQ